MTFNRIILIWMVSSSFLAANTEAEVKKLKEDRERLIDLVIRLERDFDTTLEGYEKLQRDYQKTRGKLAKAPKPEELKKAKKKLEKAVQSLRAAQVKNQESTTELKAVKGQQAVLLMDLKNLRKELHIERRQYMAATQKLDSLKSIDQKIKLLEQEWKKMSSQGQSLEVQIERLKSARGALEGQLESVMNALSQEKAARKTAEGKLAQLEKEKADLNAQVKKLQAELAQRKGELKKAMVNAQSVRELRIKVAEKNRELTKVRKELGKLHLTSKVNEQRVVALKVRLASIKPVTYELGKASVRGQQQRVLLDIKECLAMFPNAQFEIVGHTCNLGSPRANRKLSAERADSLKQYLIDNGIDEKILKSRGEGDSHPLVPNNTDSNRKKNRRVEIQVLD